MRLAKISFPMVPLWIVFVLPALAFFIYLFSVPALRHTALVLTGSITAVSFAVYLFLAPYIEKANKAVKSSQDDKIDFESEISSWLSDLCMEAINIEECIERLRSLKRILVRNRHAQRVADLMIEKNVHYLLLDLMESSFLDNDKKFDAALDLYAVLISEVSAKGPLYQGQDLFVHFRRTVSLFNNVLNHLSCSNSIAQKNRVQFLMLRTLLSASSSSIDVRDALSDLGAFQLGLAILPQSSHSDERLFLWLAMFLSTMTKDHMANIAELYHADGLRSISCLLEKNIHHKDVVYHCLLSLYSILACSSGKFSVAKARQQCLMSDFGATMSRVEEVYKGEQNISPLASAVHRSLYSTLS